MSGCPVSRCARAHDIGVPCVVSADGTREGGGEWWGGKWHSNEVPAADLLPGDILDEVDARMWRTHHDAGSAEESYSRQMRADKYLAMQQLLMAIAAAAPDDNHAMQFQPQARDILAGMVRPRGPAVRATDRAQELDTLALAYRLASGVFPVESPHLPSARTLLTEALKAWERAHPPAALDPLLL